MQIKPEECAELRRLAEREINVDPVFLYKLGFLCRDEYEQTSAEERQEIINLVTEYQVMARYAVKLAVYEADIRENLQPLAKEVQAYNEGLVKDAYDCLGPCLEKVHERIKAIIEPITKAADEENDETSSPIVMPQ